MRVAQKIIAIIIMGTIIIKMMCPMLMIRFLLCQLVSSGTARHNEHNDGAISCMLVLEGGREGVQMHINQGSN